VLRIVNELEALLVGPSLLFVKEGTARCCSRTFISILQADDELVVILIKVHLVRLFGNLLELVFAPDSVDKNFIVVAILIIVFFFVLFVILSSFASLKSHDLIKCDRLLFIDRCIIVDYDFLFVLHRISTHLTLRLVPTERKRKHSIGRRLRSSLLFLLHDIILVIRLLLDSINLDLIHE